MPRAQLDLVVRVLTRHETFIVLNGTHDRGRFTVHFTLRCHVCTPELKALFVPLASPSPRAAAPHAA